MVLFLRPADGRFRSYDSWPRVESFNNNLFLGDKQSELINSLQTELLGNNEQALHIRLIGEPGIGKSRLAFEVTKLDTLRPLVVYGKGEVFKNSDLLTRLEDPDQQVSAILVIDDCDRDTAAIIWSQLKNAGPRIRIVSISNDLEQFTGETKYFSMPSLGNEEIRKILIDYQLQSEVALRWAELCDGFPRVAHVIGSNLQQHPEDVFSSMV